MSVKLKTGSTFRILTENLLYFWKWDVFRIFTAIFPYNDGNPPYIDGNFLQCKVDGCWSGVKFIAAYPTRSTCLSVANWPNHRTCFRTLHNMHCFCCRFLCSHHVIILISPVYPDEYCTDRDRPSQHGTIIRIVAFGHCVCNDRIS